MRAALGAEIAGLYCARPAPVASAAMADARTLTRRDLNRALLARQGLLEPLATPLPRLLERIGGIQAQYAPSMYVGLFARAATFTRG